MVPVLFIVTLGTFLLVTLIPGNPEVEILGPNASPADYIRVRDELGLDDPFFGRYFGWLGDVARGDLGRSLLPPSEPVWDKIHRAFPISLQLAGMAIATSLVLAIPLAMMAAYRPGSMLDRGITASAFVMIAVPPFLLGLVIKLVLSLNFKDPSWLNVPWFPLPDSLWSRPTEKGWADNLRHAILPVATITANELSIFTRLLRNDLMRTLQDDFILAAKAKGMSARHIMSREALRPSSFSLITLAGVSLGRLIGGTLIVERIFALPGVGNVVIDAGQKKDFKVLQGGVLVIAIAYVLINLLIEIAYSVLDPRIRRGRH